MKLSDKNFSELKIGDKLISHKGTNGKIIELVPEGMPCNQSAHTRYDFVSIEWENGSKSHIFQMIGDSIEFIGD